MNDSPKPKQGVETLSNGAILRWATPVDKTVFFCQMNDVHNSDFYTAAFAALADVPNESYSANGANNSITVLLPEHRDAIEEKIRSSAIELGKHLAAEMERRQTKASSKLDTNRQPGLPEPGCGCG
jgi:hypothetical protein